MTYSIIARDPGTGLMGVATQSQALAVGASVPWAAAGLGVIATQSMGEPMYGDLGLDALRAGLTVHEALRALRSVDPHPERRQVGMLDRDGDVAVYTGEACVAAAGHAVGTGCVALANLVRGPRVWEAMVEAFEASSGWLPHRLVTALEAAEDAGGDERGRRSAAILVVRASRSGRPWRDRVTDLRVDDDPDPLGRLRRLVDTNERYHETVAAFELALDGRLGDALDRLPPPADVDDVDVVLWRALVLAAGGRAGEAAALGRRLVGRDARAAGIARRFAEAGLVDRALVDAVLGG
ncbi:MAG: DUF1028 domain-containing protein [Thermoanaerobacterales bacterium]|jgi:uncharacterized Ntn-hydrolase superfamily protein